ncbi:hypothetical protein ACVWXQ_001825 [Bradyrhizobium sp. S3.14.4]
MTFWKRRKSRLDRVAARVVELEHRLDRVAVRQVASEVLFGTATAFVIGAIPANLRRQVFHELRNCAHASGSDAVVALEAEEQFDRLLDDIQRLAEVSRLEGLK